MVSIGLPYEKVRSNLKVDITPMFKKIDCVHELVHMKSTIPYENEINEHTLHG